MLSAANTNTRRVRSLAVLVNPQQSSKHIAANRRTLRRSWRRRERGRVAGPSSDAAAPIYFRADDEAWGWLSDLHECPPFFSIVTMPDGTGCSFEFGSTEQYIQWSRTRHAGDVARAEAVLTAPAPETCRRLGDAAAEASTAGAREAWEAAPARRRAEGARGQVPELGAPRAAAGDRGTAAGRAHRRGQQGGTGEARGQRWLPARPQPDRRVAHGATRPAPPGAIGTPTCA